jgi:hypothetical protein
MLQPRSGRAVKNEGAFPDIVELAVATHELDVQLSRRIIDFHKLRDIEARHGGRMLEKIKSTIGGAFPIWRRLVISLSSLMENFWTRGSIHLYECFAPAQASYVRLVASVHRSFLDAPNRRASIIDAESAGSMCDTPQARHSKV